MIVLLNPWSTPSPKKPLPMSLLALGSVLDGEFEYKIVDGNIEPDAAGAIIAIADKRPITAIAVTVMPGPQLPDPNTEQGKSQLAFSMLTCAQQIDSKIFAYMKHIRPRRGLILDEQKQTVGTFPLFVHDGTRRGAPADAPPGMLQNLVTMETFSVRGGLIRHVEAAPFVTIPYGLGNGWTMNSGR